MVARNDITGDNIISKSLSQKGRDNWDSIFRTNQIIEGVEPTVKKKKNIFDKSKMKYTDGDNT
jgi:hypothetical protein|tara:strand:- start:1096 stop:1284 length:189 start_codon:yes stop_codon:yes gene_type:complete